MGDTGKSLKDINTKLQFCKDYLEEQLDVLIKELKAAKVGQEQLKLEYASINTEKQNCAKQIVLLNEELSESSNEVNQLKSQLKDVQTSLKEYESGEARSAAVLNEIKKERRMFQGAKESMEKNCRFENENGGCSGGVAQRDPVRETTEHPHDGDGVEVEIFPRKFHRETGVNKT